MRILLINKFLHHVGGSETYVFKLGNYLKSIDHEVQYFGMYHEDMMVGNDANAYTSTMEFHGGHYLSKLSYSIKTIYSKEARVQIRKVLEDFQPDVCHLNNFNYQLTPSIILEIKKWNKKCKIIYTAHDYQLICPNHMCNTIDGVNCEKCIDGHFVNCIKGKCIHGSLIKSIVGSLEGYFWKFKKVYKNIDRIICCSAFLKTKMDSNSLFQNKTVVLHNFIEHVESKETKKKDYVLYFGRYSREKGICTLLEVCNELKDISFVFAGTGPLEEEINKISNVLNVGFKKGEDLKQLISEARFTIYPSEWYENCPFSVMESQMYGTPVIGSNIGGIPELIKNNETGILFKSGDKNDLKDKIIRLWNNKELNNIYIENCKGVLFDSIEDYCKKIIKYYTE